MTLSSLSTRTSERRRNNLCICHQPSSPHRSPSSCLSPNESILQCVIYHKGHKDTTPHTPVSYSAHGAERNVTSISNLYGLLYKYLILSGLKPVNIRQIVSHLGDLSTPNGYPLTTPCYRSCASPLIGCESQKTQSAMAVETNAIRGPFNSVLNSTRPTVCIKPLSECLEEWQLPGGRSRKLSARVQCKTSPKQLTCKRVVKKYANMKKSPSTEFKRKPFLYADSPRHASPPPPSEPSPSPPSPVNPADNGPTATLKEKLLNGQTSEKGSGVTRGDEECGANGTNTAESVSTPSTPGTPNGKSLQAACNQVRRKYLKYWRKSLECTLAAGGERRFLKNVRLCDVFKPGSDKCSHARLPQNVTIPSHSPDQNTGGSTDTHSENIPCSPPQQRTGRVSRWKTEDKNIFALLNNTGSVKIQCAKTSVKNKNKAVRNVNKAVKNKRIKSGSVAPSSKKHLNRRISANVKQTSSENRKRSEKSHNQKLTSSSSTSSRSPSSPSHTNSLNCIRKSSARHCCVDITDPSLDRLRHGDDPCKTSLEIDPLENPCEKSSHQTCFSEDSAFSSGSPSSSSSSSSSSGSGIDSRELVATLPKVQRTRRKNGRSAPHSYNYFTNSEQEGRRIRRRTMCPCCMGGSPVKKRRKRRSCVYQLPGDYQRFVQSTMQLNSLRNKLHLFLTVLFPKLDPFLGSMSAESENIDLILNEAVSLVLSEKLGTSTEEPAPERTFSSTAAKTRKKRKSMCENNNNNTVRSNNNNKNKNNTNSSSSSSSSSSSTTSSMEDDEVIHSGPTLLNAKINVCRSPEQCLSSLTQKTLILISSLLPDIAFKEEHFHDVTSGHIEHLIDLVVRSNRSDPSPEDL